MTPKPIRRPLLLGLALLACAILYWPSLSGPFLFDDFPNLAALDSIRGVHGWRDLGIYLSQPRDFPGRPLAMLSFLPQAGAWPGNPFPFKLVNLLIHLGCGVLVFLLVRILARATLDTPRAGIADVAGVIAAAAWLLDPIQLSGVALAVQRMTLLMALFVLLGLLAYLRALLRSDLPAQHRAAWMIVGLWVCMGLAVLCKENGILLPVYALVLDATVLRGAVSRLPRALAILRRVLIWPVCVFVLGYLVYQGWAGWGHAGIRDYTVGERLLTEPRILWDYLNRMFFPRFGAAYGLYQDGYVVSRSLGMPWSTLPALLGVGAALLLGFAARKRWPLLALAILWYLAGQSIESSTIMLELYFEHRNYVPSIGIFAAAAIAIARIDSARARAWTLFASVLWLVASSITTGLSARAYQSEARLTAIWSTQQPDSIRAQTMLANHWLQSGQPEAARAVVEAAQRINPRNPALAEMHLYLDCMIGTASEQEVDDLADLLRMAPWYRTGHEYMEQLRLMARSGQCSALTPARWRTLVQALLENPAYARNGISAGFLHYQLAQDGLSEGNLDTVIHELGEAYRFDPDANLPRLQAQYLASAGLFDDAIRILQNTDYTRLPRLRRLLVDDRAINGEFITALQEQKLRAAASGAQPSRESE